MRTFLKSRARWRGGYSPEELSMLDRVCKAAVLQLGLTARDDIDGVAAGTLSLYDMGANDPEEILRALMLAFSSDRRMKQRGTAGPGGVGLAANKALPEAPAAQVVAGRPA